MLHVVFGESAGGTIRHALPDAQILARQDPLSCGPIGRAAALEAWLPKRARYWRDTLSVELNVRGHEAQFIQALCAAPQLMLWVGTSADEQLLAAWTFELLRFHGADPKVEWIALQPRPGEGFSALGHQPVERVKPLLASARPVSAETRERYLQAWRAWSHADPGLLLDFVATSAGPAALVAALDALRGRYPDAVHGLPHWEHRLLHHASVHAPHFVRAMGHVLGEMSEDGPDAVGDAWLYGRMRRHAAPHAQRPLLQFEHDEPQLSRQRARLTDDGRAVLNGTANAIALNGYADRIGGVDLAHPGGRLWLRTADSLVPHQAP